MGCLLLLLMLIGAGFLGVQQPAMPTNLPPVEASTFIPAYTDDVGIVVTRYAVARGSDADGCPVEETTTFRRSEDVHVFAIGAFPRGTDIFARLYYDGVPTEDTDIITADQNYDEVCAYFIFEPTVGAEVFDLGPYIVEFFINGVSAGSVGFVVEQVN